MYFTLCSNVYNYNVHQNISSGVEYDVTVGTVASCSSTVVVANASALRTLIPGTCMYVENLTNFNEENPLKLNRVFRRIL